MWVLESLPKANGPQRLVALFGLGLIGSACLKWLRSMEDWEELEIPFSWTPYSSEDETRLLEVLRRRVAVIMRSTNSSSPVKISFVWCAGRCGFGATEAEVEGELANFSRVVSLAENVIHLLPACLVDLTLVSSAGGLFEGTRLVTPNTSPNPLRPYGQLKLDQERALLGSDSNLGKTILRPSSVFGPVTRSGRLGVIPVFIRNGLRRSVSTQRISTWPGHGRSSCAAKDASSV